MLSKLDLAQGSEFWTKGRKGFGFVSGNLGRRTSWQQWFCDIRWWKNQHSGALRERPCNSSNTGALWSCRARIQKNGSFVLHGSMGRTASQSLWSCKRKSGIDSFYSVLQRTVLTLNYFETLNALKTRILNFQRDYETVAKPFKWKFTKEDLKNLLLKFDCEQKTAAWKIRHRTFAPEY